MTMMLRTPKDDYDLGPTLEFLNFQQELAQLAVKDEKEFPHIFGIVDLNEEEVDSEWLKACAAEAKEALKLYGKKLSEHGVWVLGELAGLANEK